MEEIAAATPGIECWAFDFSIEAIAQAQTCSSIKSQHANLNFPLRLPTHVEQAGGFGLVVASAILEFLPEPVLVDTMRRLLSPEGLGVVTSASQVHSKWQLRTYTQISLPPVLRRGGLKIEAVLKYGIWVVVVVKL
jgi:hypothetical protein